MSGLVLCERCRHATASTRWLALAVLLIVLVATLAWLGVILSKGLG
jgi:hypothetical protein